MGSRAGTETVAKKKIPCLITILTELTRLPPPVLLYLLKIETDRLLSDFGLWTMVQIPFGDTSL